MSDVDVVWEQLVGLVDMRQFCIEHVHVLGGVRFDQMEDIGL